MDAGVPIKKPVAGVAMGLIKEGESVSVLSDIQGMEDALGDMDFKVAGTATGVTALQMDIKVSGIGADILEKALEQAKAGRMHILEKMLETIGTPRDELSPYAPRIITINIHPDKIREVIGPGGKMINKIISETNTKIDIENDGRVMIASVDMDGGRRAVKMIETLTKDIEVGEEYSGEVTRIMDFGAFVELVPGKEGLVHISGLSNERVRRVEDVVQIGDKIDVTVTEIDRLGRINLTKTGVERQRPSGSGRPQGGSAPRRRFDSERPRSARGPAPEKPKR